MFKRVMLALAILFGTLAVAAPANASVPDWDYKAPAVREWDKVSMPSVAQVAQIEAANVPVAGNGWSFHPASSVQTVETVQIAARRAANDCAQLGFFFCTWKDINYSGLWWAFSQNTINGWYNYSFSFRSSPPPGGINNTGSSWVNDTTFSMRLFDDPYCDTLYGSGWYRDMSSGQQATAQGSDWNDKVSAIGRIIRTDGIDC